MLIGAGIESALISRGGDDLFSVETARATRGLIRGRVLVFSRKRDLWELGTRSLLARQLVYWRHIPFIQTSWIRQVIDKFFVAVMSHFGQVVSVCDELADDIRVVPLVAPMNVSSCYSPLGLERPQRIAIRPIENLQNVRLVYFGREGGQKQISDVISLVDAANGLGIGVTMCVFGYSKRPDDVPDNPHVYFLGRTEEPLSEIARSDGLILLSQYEGFPTVLMEAAITGTPIFCNDFRTGLKDFERLVGPTNRISPTDSGSLAVAILNSNAGAYELGGLANDTLLDQWRKVLKFDDNPA
jgi:glycosyltransferase involved in cell wall biosynthesis